MSTPIETGFKANYEVLIARSIKVTPSGDMNGSPYSGSVKFKVVNINQEDDKEYGLIEKETVIEFKIPGEDKDLRKFNQFLRAEQKANRPLVLTGSIPRQAQGTRDVYTVTSVQTCAEILAAYTK